MIASIKKKMVNDLACRLQYQKNWHIRFTYIILSQQGRIAHRSGLNIENNKNLNKFFFLIENQRYHI